MMISTLFHSIYEDCGKELCSRFVGKEFEVKEVITHPTPEIDEESLPMYLIECDGVTFHAWPEEVEE